MFQTLYINFYNLYSISLEFCLLEIVIYLEFVIWCLMLVAWCLLFVI